MLCREHRASRRPINRRFNLLCFPWQGKHENFVQRTVPLHGHPRPPCALHPARRRCVGGPRLGGRCGPRSACLRLAWQRPLHRKIYLGWEPRISAVLRCKVRLQQLEIKLPFSWPTTIWRAGLKRGIDRLFPTRLRIDDGPTNRGVTAMLKSRRYAFVAAGPMWIRLCCCAHTSLYSRQASRRRRRRARRAGRRVRRLLEPT